MIYWLQAILFNSSTIFFASLVVRMEKLLVQYCHGMYLSGKKI